MFLFCFVFYQITLNTDSYNYAHIHLRKLVGSTYLSRRFHLFNEDFIKNLMEKVIKDIFSKLILIYQKIT